MIAHKFDPMHSEFAIRKLFTFAPLKIFGIHNTICITNIDASLLAVVVIVSCLALYTMIRGKASQSVPDRFGIGLEKLYCFIANMIQTSAGESNAKITNLIFSIFLFIMLANIIGLMPYGFASTAHIGVVLTLSILIYSVMILTAIQKFGIHFYKIFIPHGTPTWLIPLILILELFTNVAKPLSLAMRLMANMIAGHIVLALMAFLGIMFGIMGIMPIAFIMIMSLFEICIAILQAYIFALLSSIYIGEIFKHAKHEIN